MSAVIGFLKIEILWKNPLAERTIPLSCGTQQITLSLNFYLYSEQK